MTLLQNVEQVLGAMADLHDLRNRLAALDEERALVEGKIRARLAEIANAAEANRAGEGAVSAAKVVRSPGVTERVLAAVNGDDNPAGIGAMDIGRAWGTTDENTINSIRAALSRLTADKKIRKLGYGRYTSIQVQGRTGGATAA